MAGRAEELAREVAGLLVAAGETVAVVDGACGGLISHVLTNLAGSSRWYHGGIVSYGFEVKHDVLSVDPNIAKTAGTVSAESALAQASGARRRLNASWGIAETGIAGPQTGRRSGKAAGLAFVAVAGPGPEEPVRRAREIVTGLDDRLSNKEAFCEATLQLFLEVLRERADGR